MHLTNGPRTSLGDTPSLVGKAFEVAFAAHAGQTDKSGAPYIAHVVRVAAKLTLPEDQIVALLHDTVEDCDTTLEEIAATFGPGIAAAVDAITKRDHEPLEDYIARVRANPIATRVKRADVADNSDPTRMDQLSPEFQERLRAKYAKVLALLETDHG